MKKRITFLALAILMPLIAAADVRIMHIDSRALAGNLAGDPAKQSLAVYLPPGYANGNQRYPVTFLLHGIADSYEVWTNAWKVPAMLDRLIAGNRIAPMIVVMPNARNRFLGSYYLNSPVTGRWADYIANELVAMVDKEFRTIAKPESRAVIGHSMGGFGAIHFAMTRPDVFSVAYAMSPCCLDAIEDVGGGNLDAWKTALSFKSYDDVDRTLQEGKFYPVALIGLLSAMAPDPAQPMKVRFPMKSARGELVPVHPAYDELLEQFPVHAVEEHRANLMKMRAIAMDVGYDDQFRHIPAATIAFSRELAEQRVPHLLDTYQGDHRELVVSRMERIIFPWLSRNLVSE